jgi:hypothetical protein
VNPEDSPALGGAWKGKSELLVEASGAPQRWVDGVWPVGGANDDHTPSYREPVHEGQQRGDDGGVDLVLLGRANRCQTVDLVEEDDGGCPGLGFGEEESQLAFRLTHPLGEAVGALSDEKRNLLTAGGSEGPGNERFPASRGAVEEDTLRRFQGEGRKQLGADERKIDHLLQPSDVVVESRHVSRKGKIFGHRDGLDIGVGRLALSSRSREAHHRTGLSTGRRTGSRGHLWVRESETIGPFGILEDAFGICRRVELPAG